MNDTHDDVDVIVEDRDDATRAATRQFVAAVLDLRDAFGRTPYITTVLNSVAEITNAIGRLANIAEKAERWLDVNGTSCARPSTSVDNAELLKDLRRDLKGLTAALARQQRLLHDSTSRAWTHVAHREGVVGREVL